MVNHPLGIELSLKLSDTDILSPSYSCTIKLVHDLSDVKNVWKLHSKLDYVLHDEWW